MIEQLLPLVLKVGRVIMDFYQKDVIDIRIKSDGSPVTIADEQAESIIIKGLQHAFPNIPIIAEEQAAMNNFADISGGRFFLVDALDGTKQFIKHQEEFTINIALIEQNIAVFGIIYAPVLREIYYGRVGQGAYFTNDLSRPSWQQIKTRKRTGNSIDIIASHLHKDQTIDGINLLLKSEYIVANWLKMSSSLKFCRLAAGQADLYPRRGRTMEWDTAAGDAILRAAGGRILTWQGDTLGYGKLGDDKFANPNFLAMGDLI